MIPCIFTQIYREKQTSKKKVLDFLHLCVGEKGAALNGGSFEKMLF